jgi:hypothetical protein
VTDPRDDDLRQAMTFGAGEFFPAGPLGATRATVVAHVKQRRRTLSVSVAALVAVAAVAAIAAVAAGGSLGGSGSDSRRVASRGADPPLQSVASANRGVAATGPGASAAVSTGASAGATTHKSSPMSTPPTTNAAVPTTPTTAPSGTTATTIPPITTPVTTVLPAVSAVHGTVLFSPTCPVEQVPPNPACAPRPGAAHIQLVRADGTTAAQGDAGSNGQFFIQVAPGSYTVKATAPTPAAIGRGCTANPSPVTVTPSAASSVAVSCDTGIR